MTKIAVVTSIVGGKDRLIEDQPFSDDRFIAFLDEIPSQTGWEVRPAYSMFRSPRRNSRIHKICIHQFVEADVSIWIDGNARLLSRPEDLVSRFLGEADIAVFRHPERSCIYDEIEFCTRYDLANAVLLVEQASVYRNRGFPERAGLCECGMIIRRHTQHVERLNNMWWSEYSRYAARDQISFMFAKRSSGILLSTIDIPWTKRDGAMFKEGILELRPHLTARKEID